MAAKKDNKAIGNLIIAVIPLIGIVWAGVAGIQHSGYVKDVKNAEQSFETKLVQKINELDLSKENNIVIEKLNVTSVIPCFYETKLRDDKVSKGNSSHSIKLSANPTVATNDKNETYVEKFEFNYEFFIDSESYEELLKTYAQGKNVLEGYEEYIYLTYNENNPKNSVIYMLDPLFDKFYKNVLFYEFQEEVLYGLSSSLVIEMIEELPETLNANKQELDAYKKLLNEIKTQYGLLNATQQAEVSNYSVYEQSVLIYEAKVVEKSIDDLNDLTDSSQYKLSDSTAADNALKAYNKLSDDQKALVSNYSELEEKIYNCAIFKAEYYVLLLENKPQVDDYKDEASYNKALADYEKNYDGRVKNSVKFYNGLTNEQKADYSADLLAKLKVHITTYNTKYPNATLKLNEETL